MKRTAKAIITVILLAIVVTYCVNASSYQKRAREFYALFEENTQVTDEPVAEPELTAEPEPIVTEAPIEEEPESALPDVDISSWELRVVNVDNPLDSDYAPPEISYLGDEQCPVDSRIAEALTAFAEAAKAEGLPVYLSSGYRSYSEQQGSFNAMVAREGSEEAAATIVARPGTSEHQYALSCDITDIYRNPKNPDVLENTETYIWMSQHCQEYGFIVRYPKDKSEITGIIYEPWHFRYVGVEAATYIMENDLCLEEFVGLYEEG
jgi:D-alanyl-D-alanine carboxypeptidase